MKNSSLIKIKWTPNMRTQQASHHRLIQWNLSIYILWTPFAFGDSINCLLHSSWDLYIASLTHQTLPLWSRKGLARETSWDHRLVASVLTKVRGSTVDLLIE